MTDEKQGPHVVDRDEYLGVYDAMVRDGETERDATRRVLTMIADESYRRTSTLRERVSELELLADGKLKEAAQAYLRSAGQSCDGFDFNIQATIVPLIAEHLAETMKGLGGDNYVSFEVHHDELGPLELTLRKRSGEMPATKASRLENELATLRAERDELREEIQRRDQAWLAETRTNEEVVKEMTGQYVPLAIPKHMVSDDQVRTIMDDCEGEARATLSTKGDGDEKDT